MPAKSTQPLPIEATRSEIAFGEYIDFPDVGPNSPYRPNKQYFVEALSEGSMVGIHRLKEYPTFFELFERYKANHRLKLRLYVRQVKEDLWILLARKPSDPKPGSMLDGDFREHGRYVWYTSQLENGNTVEVESDEEARKVRRAWMISVRPENRRDREGVIEPKNKKYLVFLRAPEPINWINQ